MLEQSEKSIWPQEIKWPILQEDKQKCPRCSITLERVMMYCCPNNNCPCGLGSRSIM